MARWLRAWKSERRGRSGRPLTRAHELVGHHRVDEESGAARLACNREGQRRAEVRGVLAVARRQQLADDEVIDAVGAAGQGVEEATTAHGCAKAPGL
jgi:hypothetical protein